MSTFYRSGKIIEEYELDSQVFLSHIPTKCTLICPISIKSRDEERIPFKRIAI